MTAKHPAYEKWWTDHIWVFNGSGRRIAKLERSSKDGRFIASAPRLARAALAMLTVYDNRRDEPGSVSEQEQAARELRAVLSAIGILTAKPKEPADAQ